MRHDAPAGDEGTDFETERHRLFGLAYRMLGSVMDAEDVVQEAWLRWDRADTSALNRPRAYLSTIVARLCLDRLQEARRRRELYVGQWLPEPLVHHAEPDEAGVIPLESDVSFALLLALERLSPLERAAFLLHDVFETPYADVAAILDRSEQTCRQLASRARRLIETGRRRFAPAPERVKVIADAFFAAARTGDTAGLSRILADDVALHSDGGGKKISVLNVVCGKARISRFFAGLARKPWAAPPVFRIQLRINGLPAEATVEADGTRQIAAIELDGKAVRALYIVRNPEKLMRVWASLPKAPAAF